MKLYIKNFQGISEAEINLKGFTVLTGSSNSGKSSIRRALELVLYNRWDIGFLKTGETHCVVKLSIDEDNYIQITKPDNTYTVSINGNKSVYPKVGKNTLSELNELGLDHFYDSEGYYYNVHIRSQIDPWYYITFSNQEQSRIIASIFNFDEIKSILKKSYKDKTEVTSQAENLASDIDNLKIEGQELSVKLNLLNKLKTKLEEQLVLSDYLSLVSNISSKKSSLDIMVNKVRHIDNIMDKLSKSSYVSEHLNIKNKIQELKGDICSTEIVIQQIAEKTRLLKSITASLDSIETLEQYISLSDDVSKLNKDISSKHSKLKTVKSKISISKTIRDNILTKSKIESHIELSNNVNTARVYLNHSVDKLKKLVILRNKLIRFSSLKGYLMSRKQIKDTITLISKSYAKVKHIEDITGKINDYLFLSKHIILNSTVDAIKSDIVENKNSISSISIKIKEAKKVINESVLCPHCSQPIGDFVKGCTNG